MKTPPALFLPPHRGQKGRGCMANKDTGRTEPPQDHRAILIRCITRQLQRMNMGDLREAYTAVSKISDRTKKPM